MSTNINFDDLYQDLIRQAEYLNQHPLDTWLAIRRHLYPGMSNLMAENIYANLQHKGYREQPGPWPRDSWARWLLN